MAHGGNIGKLAEPVFEGDGALPEEHALAGGGAAAAGGGGAVQGGFVGHDVVHALTGVQKLGGEGHGVALVQPQAGGVHDEVCCGHGGG